MIKRKVTIKVLVLVSVLAASLLTVLTAQAHPRQTLLYVEAGAVQGGTDTWTVTATVTNVGMAKARPAIKVSVIALDQSGRETTLAIISRKKALKAGKSIVYTFTVSAAGATELVVKAKAKNTLMSFSDPIPLAEPAPLLDPAPILFSES